MLVPLVFFSLAQPQLIFCILPIFQAVALLTVYYGCGTTGKCIVPRVGATVAT